MNDFTEELRELRTFVADLKTDRAAQKEKEQREAWTKYTSLSLVFIAVLAAIATQWAGKYSSRVLVSLNDSTFNQALATDEWSFYQAKSIKQNLYEVARDQLAQAAGTANGEMAKTEAKITSKIEKYEKEKKDIQEEAKRLEKLRDDLRGAATLASKKGGGMGLAVSIFQISIALGSICLVTKRKQLWYLALVFAMGATVEMIRIWMI